MANPQPGYQHMMFGNPYAQAQDQYQQPETHFPLPHDGDLLPQHPYPSFEDQYLQINGQYPEIDNQPDQEEDQSFESPQSPYQYPTAEYLAATHLNVDAVVKEWAEQNVDKIVKAYKQKGGWEGWAQVELAIQLQDRLETIVQNLNNSRDDGSQQQQQGISINVRREVAVYRSDTEGASRKRADIVIEWNDKTAAEGGDPVRYFIIIELKCESSHNTNQFITAVKEDDKKMEGELLERYLPAMPWAFSFSVSDGAHQKRKEMKLGHGEEVPVHNDPKIKKVVLWWNEEDLVCY